VESIVFLDDIRTIEMFYLQAQSLISQVGASLHSITLHIHTSFLFLNFQSKFLLMLPERNLAKYAD